VAQKQSHLWQSALVMSASLLAAGVVVGAIHGAFLVRLASQNQTKIDVQATL